jgi:hypothetical protein
MMTSGNMCKSSVAERSVIEGLDARSNWMPTTYLYSPSRENDVRVRELIAHNVMMVMLTVLVEDWLH